MKELIFLFLFSFTFSQIVIPFTYYPVKSYSQSTIAEQTEELFRKSMYVTIDIGNQKHDLLVGFEDFLTYIVPLEQLGDPGNDKFSQFKNLYSLEKSNSKQVLESIEDLFDYTYDISLAEKASDNFVLKRKVEGSSEEYNLYFIDSYSFDFGTGVFPLQICSSLMKDDKIFYNSLVYFKKKNLIQKYTYSFYFNPETNYETGYLILGSLPHEIGYKIYNIKNEEFKSEDLNGFQLKINGDKIGLEIGISNIYFTYKRNNKDINYYNTLQDSDFIKELNQINIKLSLDYNMNAIVGPESIQDYFDNIFTSYISSGKCENVRIFLRPNYYEVKVCKNEIYDELLEKIPTIILKQNELVYNFTLTNEDLLLKHNDHIYFKLFFQDKKYFNKNWILGRPFLRKYPITIDLDKKQLFYYSTILNNGYIPENNGIKIFIIVLLCIIFSVLGILIGKKIYGIKIRKIRANELEEQFEYKSKQDFNNSESESGNNKLFKN